NLGISLRVERAAGAAAWSPNEAYLDQGATIGSRPEIFAADLIAMVRTPGANPCGDDADVSAMRTGQVVIGFADTLTAASAAAAVAARGARLIAMELVP